MIDLDTIADNLHSLTMLVLEIEPVENVEHLAGGRGFGAQLTVHRGDLPPCEFQALHASTALSAAEQTIAAAVVSLFPAQDCDIQHDPYEHPSTLLSQLITGIEGTGATVEDLRAWRTAAAEFVRPIEESADALRSLVGALSTHATATDEDDVGARVLQILDTMRRLASVLDKMGGPMNEDRASAFAALRCFQARCSLLATALHADSTPLEFCKGLAEARPLEWRLELAARIVSRLVVEVRKTHGPVPRSLLVVARQALADAEHTLQSSATFDADEGDDAVGLTRRAMEAEGRLAAFALEHLVDDVEHVDPLLLPEPRRWGPYPGLCHKLEREELLATFVSLGRARGRFDWCAPLDVLEHAQARRHQWVERAQAMPSTVPHPQTDGVEHGLLDAQPDATHPGRFRYRLSIRGLRLVLQHVAARRPSLREPLALLASPTDDEPAV
jgi:hypothetical protein